MIRDFANRAILRIKHHANKKLRRHIIQHKTFAALKAKLGVHVRIPQRNTPLYALSTKHREAGADEGSADALALSGREDGDGTEADPLARARAAGWGDCYGRESDMANE